MIFSDYRKRSYTIPDHSDNEFGYHRRESERRGFNHNNRYSSRRGNFQYRNSSYHQPYDNFRQRNPRKRPYEQRHYFDRQGDRKYSKSKFNSKFSSRGRPFDYKQDRVGGFKAPRQLNTQQQKRRHLKKLRKTAAELASKEDGCFVYKPGMIGLLRPSTPMNTTQFLSKQKKSSPKMNVKHEANEKEINKCFSVCDDKNDMTEYQQICGSRTPDPKLSPLNMPSDYENPDVSHYSDIDAFFENDCISGTMEGLVNGNIFDNDPIIKNQEQSQSTELQAAKENENMLKIPLDIPYEESMQNTTD